MIYRNGKKISAIFRNGKAISKIFRDGKLIWQKDKPEAKRVKSIKVSLPSWGTVERVEWESILRAVPRDINGYYLDVTINGLGVRLRGNGGRYVGEVEGDIIHMPDNLFVTTDDLYVGQVLSFSAKTPSVTSSPTNVRRGSTYAYYEFSDAPFFNGSKFAVTASITGGIATLNRFVSYTLEASLVNSTLANEDPSVRSKGSFKRSLSLSKVYEDDNFEKMATYQTNLFMQLNPSFHFVISSDGSISKSATLTSPACDLYHKCKITRIETY